MVVKSNIIYSPQNYLEVMTGNCYFFINDRPILDQVTDILKLHNCSTKSYSLKETPKLLHRNISVVLVDCCDVDNNGNPIKDYRWFRVPINFKD